MRRNDSGAPAHNRDAARKISARPATASTGQRSRRSPAGGASPRGGLCDWCGRAVLAGTEFEHNAVSRKLYGEAQDIHVIWAPSWWLGCPECASLVRRRKFRKLLDRSCDGELLAGGPVPGWVRAELAAFQLAADQQRTGRERPWTWAEVA